MEDLNLGSEMGEIYIEREEQTQRGEVCTTKKYWCSEINPIGLILKFVWNSHDTHVASSPRETGEEKQVSWTLHEEKHEFFELLLHNQKCDFSCSRVLHGHVACICFLKNS